MEYTQFTLGPGFWVGLIFWSGTIFSILFLKNLINHYNKKIKDREKKYPFLKNYQ